MSYKLKKENLDLVYWFRDYRLMNIDRCNHLLGESNFSNFLSTHDIEDQVDIFNNILRDCFEESVPLKKYSTFETDKWMISRELEIARINRNLAWKAFSEYRSEYNRKIYCKYRNKVKSVIRCLRKKYFIRFFDNCSQSGFWRKLRSEGVLGDDNNTGAVNVEEFNQQSVLPPIDNDCRRMVSFCSNRGFTFRNVDECEVFDAMTRIKSNSVGPDGIPIKFLKIIYPLISKNFTFMLNRIITT